MLWANTTLGMISFWWLGARQQQGRAIVTISGLPRLAVVNAAGLSDGQLKMAGKMFDGFKKKDLLPANEAWHDETRQEMDRAVLIDLLGLPEDILGPLDLLRRPVVR